MRLTSDPNPDADRFCCVLGCGVRRLCEAGRYIRTGLQAAAIGCCMLAADNGAVSMTWHVTYLFIRISPKSNDRKYLTDAFTEVFYHNRRYAFKPADRPKRVYR